MCVVYLNVVAVAVAVAVVFCLVVSGSVSVCVRYGNMYLQASSSEAR